MAVNFGITDFSINAILGNSNKNADVRLPLNQLEIDETNKEKFILPEMEDSSDSGIASASNSSSDDNSSEEGEGSDGTSDPKKPNFTYSAMIMMAMRDNPHQKLTLNEIYDYISNRFPYYKRNFRDWQNSVRHTLSLNKCFIKIQRSCDDPGRGCYWGLNINAHNMVIGEDTGKLRQQSTDGFLPSMAPSSVGYTGTYLVGRHDGYRQTSAIPGVYQFSNNGHFTVKGIQNYPGMSPEALQYFICTQPQAQYNNYYY